jgi:excisionase family DNA binding protein
MWVSTAEAAARLGVHRSTVVSRVKAGALEGHFRGRRLFVRIEVDGPRLARMEGTVDTDHVAALLGRHRNWVRRMAAEGELPALRLGAEWRFCPEEILGYIEARRLKPGDLAWNDGKGWVRQRGFRQPSPVSAAQTFG